MKIPNVQRHGAHRIGAAAVAAAHDYTLAIVSVAIAATAAVTASHVQLKQI